jgi:K+-sensing histidine kinase KdpD
MNQVNGKISSETYPILIQVDAPWYKTRLGIILISLFTIVFVWLVLQIRINRITEQKRKLSRLAWEKEHTVRMQKDSLLKTVERLRKSQGVLEENNRMKNHVISILSHDLVTPLKYIAITAKGILNHPDKYNKANLLEMIASIMNSANQLEILSTNVLNWIKYFRTNRPLTIKTFDLFEMVDRTRESLDMFMKRKGNTFYNNIPEGTFITQIYEPLAVIIFNLTSNANKYTENGEISIDFEIENDHIYIHVSDSGGGIPPEKVHRILKGEALESSPDTEMLKGNGLGYLLIRELIILIKGEIQIESEIGQGTTVTVKLPYLQLLP